MAPNSQANPLRVMFLYMSECEKMCQMIQAIMANGICQVPLSFGNIHEVHKLMD
jgi:hypothetical protein